MRLTTVSVKYFRGIQSGVFKFPTDRRLICVIGAGDSCKSTFLKAVEWALWPSWNLSVTDLDFYNSDTSVPIVIEVSIAEPPDELLTEDKFGLFLRNNTAAINDDENDEPVNNEENVITIRLFIDDTLEPIWSVITNRTEPHIITQKDRRLLSFGVVGLDYEKDFVWGRTSVLQKYSGLTKETLHAAYTRAMRSAVEKTDLSNLDKMTEEIKEIGKQYGVSFKGDIHNKLLMQNGSYSTTVGVFDEKIPFSQRGLGTKRLLSMGMNIHASKNGSLILIDEIETGLEPYRLCTLINQLRSEFSEKGQVVFTTHSRSAICECTVDELFIMNEKNGVVSWFPISEQDISETVQSLIRTEPDAFLCKRIIVCEGKTEIGLLRAVDDYLFRSTNSRFAHYGVGMALGGGGDKFFKLSKLLKKCGYDVCILMDSDISEEEKQKEEVERLGIKVFSWEEGYAIEEQLFADATSKCVEELISIGIDNKGFDSVKARLKNAVENANSIFQFCDEKVTLSDEIDSKTLLAIGKVAKGKWNQKKQTFEGGWYKRIDLGQTVGNVVLQNGQMREGSYFITVINKIKEWVIADEV